MIIKLVIAFEDDFFNTTETERDDKISIFETK